MWIRDLLLIWGNMNKAEKIAILLKNDFQIMDWKPYGIEFEIFNNKKIIHIKAKYGHWPKPEKIEINGINIRIDTDDRQIMIYKCNKQIVGYQECFYFAELIEPYNNT